MKRIVKNVLSLALLIGRLVLVLYVQIYLEFIGFIIHLKKIVWKTM